MPLFGEIVVIKRNGTDGTHFPLTANSCLFGRKKECDIRIQLPQVSKEHCKIEVNENKEAMLINLSAVNPTQLNGSILQHPTCLKHKDVLTITDRSFRFEYPPLSVPRKRNSISQEKETLQVLHIQQVDQEESFYQISECKSLQTPDKKFEWEGQNTHGSDKQKTEEHITRQYGTPGSTHKTRLSNRKNEISPFSQLYYLMKNEGERQSTKGGLSNEISAQQKEYLLKKDGHDQLAEVSTQTSRRRSAYKKIEAVIQEEAEQSRKLTSEEITDHVDFPDIKENELEISEVLKSYTSLRANTQSAEGVPKSCCIVSLEYSDEEKKQPTEATDEKIKSSLRYTSESDENSLLTPKYKGKRIQINSSPHSQEITTRRSSKSRMLPVEDNSLLDIFSPTESSIKTEGSSMYVNREEYASNIFMPNIHFDIKENSALLVTEQPLDPEILKETKDDICDTSDPFKDGNFGIIASSPYRRSPRRNMKQKKDFANEDYFKGKLTEKESLGTPTSVSPGSGRMRTPSQLSEQTVGKYCPQKTDNKIKEKPVINHKQDSVIKSNIQESSNLNESSLKSTIQMPSEEDVSEMTVSSPLNVKREAGLKKPPQKRKNRDVDLLNQPSGKRKRVSFGGHLSPELFDKRLPPNSPLKRGAIPARLSLPFGNSPRAVLKKASELGQSVSKDFSERKQRDNILPKSAASPPARRSPAASPPARRSPAASPFSSFSCDVSQKRGRFSVSRITSPSSSVEQAAIIGEKHVHEEFTEAKSSVEQAAIIGEKHVHEEFTEAKSPEPSEHEFKAVRSIRRSKRFSLKRNSLHRRSGAIDAIHSKRRSGASGANLIVAKSWAEVVKQGVPKSQLRISTKCGLTRRAKKTSKQPKSNVPVLKTPARKVKGYFTTGHANSPAPIVIGKAHTSIVKIAAQAPKVVLNFPVKQHCDLNESFTGVADMFNTPLNWKQKSSMSSVEKTNMSTPEVSALNTSENSGEMIAPSFTVSSQQICNQDVSPFLTETSQLSSLVDDRLKMSPREENTEEEIEEIVKESSSLGTAENETLVGVQVTRKSAKHKLESEVFSGIQRLMRTPKQKPEPIDALSGVKRLLRTPKTKSKPVEALSGVKRLLRTPKEKPEPVEALSGVRRLMRTPKTKSKPVEALSGVKRLFRTPKGKPKPVDALSGVKRLLRTPKEKPEPVDALSGVKRLFRMPKEKPEPVEALSEVMRAESKMELFEGECACSTVLETPEELEEPQGSVTQRTSKERAQPVGITGISYIIEEPKEKIQPVEDTEGIPSLLRGSKQRSEPVEEIDGISSQLKTPGQMFKRVDDYLGLQKFMAEPKQSYFSPEIDYTGVKEMFDIADEYKVKLPESGNLMEDCELHIHSRSELEFSGNVPENEELQQDTKLEDVFERKSSLVIPKDNCRNDPKAEDSLEDLAVSSLNEFKMGADVESIKTLCVPENSQPVGVDIQNGTTIDSGKTARQASPGIMDAELLQPLASTRQTRKGDKSNSTEESKTKKTRSRAKSTNCTQTNENSDENVTVVTKRSTRGKSRQHPAERNTVMESDTVMQTQESSKETSVKIHQSVKRQVAAQGLGQAKARLNSKETATTEENGSQLITKPSLRARNKKDDKNELKSEFTKINRKDKMQCEDPEHSEIKCGKNDVFKRNTRGKGGDPMQTGSEKDKPGSLEFITQETSGTASLESNPTKVNIVRKGKGKRNVHFLLEEHNSVPLVEKSVVVVEGVAREEKDNPFFETSVPISKGKTSRGRKRKAPVASLPVCTSPTRKNELTEMGQAEQKEGISLPLEHSTFVKDDSSGSSSFVQEKCSQEIQTKENEILRSVQTLDHSPAKQKVIKKKPIKRGKSKQAISHGTSTEYDHQAADIEDQNVAIAIIENMSKRGRRKIAPVSQISLPLENRCAKEIPSTDNFSFAEAKGSLQHIKNEEIPAEIQNVALKNTQAPLDDSASKRQNVTQDHTLRRGRSKHATSHETAIKYENKESADTKDQNVVVKNASTKENPSKRGRVKKVSPVSQTLLSPLKNDNLPLPSSTNSKSTGEHDKASENAEFTTANGSLSHRGRRRKMEDIPIASSVSARKRSKLLNNDQEKVLEDLQGVTNDNVYKRSKRNVIPYEISAAGNGQPGNDSKEAIPIKEKEPLENGFGKENQPMRSRRKNVPASQIPPSLKVSITLPSAPSNKGETTTEQSMLIRPAIGEEKIVNSNGKKVLCSATARRRCKLSEEICQEKQNVDLEKTAVSNKRASRRGTRKADAPEATVSISCQEKCGIISEVQHEIPKHPQQKARKGKNLQKNTDPSNISNNDQNSNLGLKVLPEKGNSCKQKQVISEPESSVPTSDMKKTFFTENKSKPTVGSTESTTLQRGKRKMKEYQMAEASVEMENKTRRSRRTRK